MNKFVLNRIFGTLQTLEKCSEHCEKMLGQHKDTPIYIKRAVLEQKRILIEMRRTAIKLQLEVVKKNWDESNRQMQIFYALNTMVRPELLGTFRSLANGEFGLQLSESNAAAYH